MYKPFVLGDYLKCMCRRKYICLCPPGFHYPLYGKTAGREESEVTPPGRGGAVSGKQSGDSSSSSAMELLQQQSHQYHGKSPAVRRRSLFTVNIVHKIKKQNHKFQVIYCLLLSNNVFICVFVFEQPGEKGSPEGERETERERNHLSFARHLHTHHHTHLGMSYNLMSGQYDIYQGTNTHTETDTG